MNVLRCTVPLKNEIRRAAIFPEREYDNEASGKKCKRMFYFWAVQYTGTDKPMGGVTEANKR